MERSQVHAAAARPNPPPLRGASREAPALQSWRRASRITVAHSRYAVSSLEEVLLLGGPDAIRGLRATVARLEGTIQELRGSSKLQRYTQLQAQLQEADKVKAALTSMLVDSFGVDDAALSKHLKQSVFKGADLLYGASRELLLKENKVLRAMLEQRMLTDKTSWRRYGLDGATAAAAPGSPGPGPRGAADSAGAGGRDQDAGREPSGAAGEGKRGLQGSRLERARIKAAPQVEALEQLLAAADELDRAEQAYQLPEARNACTQADDGSLKTIGILQGQVSELAGQKSNLLAKVAELQQDMVLVERRLEQALNEAAEQRRQRTELLVHREELSKDLRATLESEAKRADAAELALGEARVRIARQDKELAEARDNLAAAAAQLAALEAALEEKMSQLSDVRDMYRQLYEQLDGVRGTTQDVSQAVMDALKLHHTQQTAAMKEAQEAALQSAKHAASLVEQQARLQEEVSAHKAASGAALSALETELRRAHDALLEEQRERQREARKTMAAILLTKAEDRRHQRTLKALTSDLPAAVADNLAQPLGGIRHKVDGIADDVALANRQLTYIAEGGLASGGGGRDPGTIDVQDDETARILGQSRGLRAQLQALAAADPEAMAATMPQHLARKQQEDAAAAVGQAVLDGYREEAGQPPGPPVPRNQAMVVGAAALELLHHQKEDKEEAVGHAVLDMLAEGQAGNSGGGAQGGAAIGLAGAQLGAGVQGTGLMGQAGPQGGTGAGRGAGRGTLPAFPRVGRRQAVAVGVAALGAIRDAADAARVAAVGDAVVQQLHSQRDAPLVSGPGEGQAGPPLPRDQAWAVGAASLGLLRDEARAQQAVASAVGATGAPGRARRGSGGLGGDADWQLQAQRGRGALGAAAVDAPRPQRQGQQVQGVDLRAGIPAPQRTVLNREVLVAVGHSTLEALERQRDYPHPKPYAPHENPEVAAAVGAAVVQDLTGRHAPRPADWQHDWQQLQHHPHRQQHPLQHQQQREPVHPAGRGGSLHQEWDLPLMRAVGNSTLEALERQRDYPNPKPYAPHPNPAIADAVGAAVLQDLSSALPPGPPPPQQQQQQWQQDQQQDEDWGWQEQPSPRRMSGQRQAVQASWGGASSPLAAPQGVMYTPAHPPYPPYPQQPIHQHQQQQERQQVGAGGSRDPRRAAVWAPTRDARGFSGSYVQGAVIDSDASARHSQTLRQGLEQVLLQQEVRDAARQHRGEVAAQRQQQQQQRREGAARATMGPAARLAREREEEAAKRWEREQQQLDAFERKVAFPWPEPQLVRPGLYVAGEEVRTGLKPPAPSPLLLQRGVSAFSGSSGQGDHGGMGGGTNTASGNPGVEGVGVIAGEGSSIGGRGAGGLRGTSGDGMIAAGADEGGGAGPEGTTGHGMTSAAAAAQAPDITGLTVGTAGSGAGAMAGAGASLAAGSAAGVGRAGGVTLVAATGPAAGTGEGTVGVKEAERTAAWTTGAPGVQGVPASHEPLAAGLGGVLGPARGPEGPGV